MGREGGEGRGKERGRERERGKGLSGREHNGERSGVEMDDVFLVVIQL